MNIRKLYFSLMGLMLLLAGCIDLNREDFTEIYPDNFSRRKLTSNLP